MNDFAIDYSTLPFAEEGQLSDQNRFNWRCETILTRNQALIKDKVVLDLACNNGRMAYPCLQLGAKKVIGVEGRPILIEQGNKIFENTEYRTRMEFVQGDVFDYLASASKNEFDVILCLGFLYHTVRQVDFFRQVKRLAPSPS